MEFAELTGDERIKLEHYRSEEYTELLTDIDEIRSIRPDGQANLGQEVIFRIPRSGEMFLGTANLVCRLSPIGGTVAGRRFIGATAINMIDYIRIYHGSKIVWELLDMTAPYQKLLTFIDEDYRLPHFRELINDVSNTTLAAQATTGVTTYLRLDLLTGFFSHPLPLAAFADVLELRIKFKSAADIVAVGDATSTVSLQDCYLRSVYQQPGNAVAQEARTLVRNGSFRYFVSKYMNMTFTIPGGSTSYSNNLSSFLNKSVVMLWFFVRAKSDLAAKNFTGYKQISKWQLQSAGAFIDNTVDGWTHEEFNGWYLLENHITNIDQIKNKNVYFINYSNNLHSAFGSGDAEIETFQGATSFVGKSDLSFRLEFPSALTGDHELLVTAVIPSYLTTENNLIKLVE